MSTATATSTAPLPLVLAAIEVIETERLSPSFVRIAFGGAALADCGVEGPLLDQRIKLIFPSATGTLPALQQDASWWESWMEIPEGRRGSMRTYTIADLVGAGAETRLLVDIVVHDPTEHSGPGNDWALAARPGDRVVLVAPRRGHAFGGIEWAPGDASRLLLAGDETVVPAIRGVLRDLPPDATGAVFVEVPTAADVLADVFGPGGVSVTWLPREGRPRGEELHAAVLAHLTGDDDGASVDVADDEVDPDLWETPVYSSSGEEIGAGPQAPASPYSGLYAWIAGESKIVTGLRRRLVAELGIDRSQVAFMGYWREGVAMRS